MSSQRTIVREMLPFIAAMTGDAGVCITNPEGRAQAIEYIDLATDNMMKRLDSEGMMFNWYVPVCHRCIALPQDCREARQIVMNGVPLIQRDQWYLGKVCNGYGWHGCGPAECLDLGDFYIPHPLPKQRGIRIALVALNPNDAGVECEVQVLNEYGHPVKETVTLLDNQVPAIMEAVAYDVTFFLKPKTLGPVALQLHYDDGQRIQWCEYLPHTEEGLFRRKSIPNRFHGCNIARVVGKLRYDRITSEDQIMPINDRIGMGYAVAAISAWKRGDTTAYNENMLLALNEIKKQMEDGDSAANIRQVKFRTDFANPSQAGGGRCWN
jgi:hypothetical protein